MKPWLTSHDDPAKPLPASQWLEGGPNVADFTGLALWMAGTLAGLATAAIVAQAPLFRALAAKVGWTGNSKSRRDGQVAATPPSPERALPMLADAIIGNTKRAIAGVFGPPRSAVVANPKTALTTIWHAETWYYPLPRQGHLALAIEFDHDDYASRVLFLKAPANVA